MPGQFINTGTTPNGGLQLVNVNNQGSLSMNVAAPASVNYLVTEINNQLVTENNDSIILN